MDDKLARLKQIGFVKAGQWAIDGDGIACELQDLANASNVLYAFSIDGNLAYIGKTGQPLRARLSGYRNPAPKSSTNVKNNRNIRDCLARSKQIEIFALPDSGMLSYGGFHLNLAAGLEDSLIRDLEPAWNGGQKEGLDQSLHQTESPITVFGDGAPSATESNMAAFSPTANDFRSALFTIFTKANESRSGHVEVNAGQLHRQVGGYPGPNHRMATCCDVMTDVMNDGDSILPGGPPKGRGASLTIKYLIPRKQR